MVCGVWDAPLWPSILQQLVCEPDRLYYIISLLEPILPWDLTDQVARWPWLFRNWLRSEVRPVLNPHGAELTTGYARMRPGGNADEMIRIQQMRAVAVCALLLNCTCIFVNYSAVKIPIYLTLATLGILGVRYIRRRKLKGLGYTIERLRDLPRVRDIPYDLVSYYLHSMVQSPCCREINLSDWYRAQYKCISYQFTDFTVLRGYELIVYDRAPSRIGYIMHHGWRYLGGHIFMDIRHPKVWYIIRSPTHCDILLVPGRVRSVDNCGDSIVIAYVDRPYQRWVHPLTLLYTDMWSKK